MFNCQMSMKCNIAIFFFLNEAISKQSIAFDEAMTKKQPNLKCQDLILLTFISSIFSNKYWKGMHFNSEVLVSFYIF